MYTVHAESVASYSYNVVDDSYFLSIRQTQVSNAELFIFLSGDYHRLKLAVSCVSYPWLNTYDYRVNCITECSVLDLHIASY